MSLETARDAAGAASESAGQAQESPPVRAAAQVGIVAYGVVHLLIGWLALQLALADSGGAADSQGALHALAETPLGSPLLWLLCAGFVALVVWQIAEAVSPTGSQEGSKRQLERGLAVAKAALFAVLAFSSAQVALGNGNSGGGSTEESLTAELMRQPAGQWLVGVAGLLLVGVGFALIWRGWTEGFRDHLGRSAGGRTGRALIRLGKFGYCSKGAALGVLGALVVTAAVQHDADRSGGLDDALRTLLREPYGAVAVVAIGAGFAAYGIFCFARARDLRAGKG